jgi:Derlin-2/3
LDKRALKADMNQPMGQVGQADSIQDMYRNIPFVTKVLVTSTVLLATGITFNMINPVDVVLDYQYLVKKFHIWRLFTPFIFAGPFSFNFLMHTVVLYENCRNYEVNPFNTGGGGTSADFLWMVIMGMLVFIVIGIYLEIYVMSEAILFMILYVWSRRDPTSIRNIFGFRFQGLYLPWIYVGIRLLMGSSIAMPIIGIVVGHAYYFAIEVMPNAYNIDFIRTPQFCVDIVTYFTGRSPPPVRPAAMPGFGNAPQAAPQRNFANLGGGYNWGQGRPLGR